MAQQNSSEEVDLGTIFGKLRDGYHGFLIFFYRFLQFLIRSWIVILLLIVCGIILGYFWDKGSQYSKETTLYVQINFDAANYIYDAVESLNFKIIDNDTVFLKNLGLGNNGKLLIRKIEIEPLVNITDILNKIDQDNKNVETFLEQAQYEDNLLTSEIFVSDYKTHKIELILAPDADEKIIENIMAYFNDNQLLNKIKNVTIEDTKRKIDQNNINITNMDSIARVLGSKNTSNGLSNQIYFNNVSSDINNLHLLFREINTYIDDNQKFKIELLKYNNVVQLINKPILKVKKGILDSKIYVPPIIFLFLFFVFVIIRRLYLKAKVLHKLKN